MDLDNLKLSEPLAFLVNPETMEKYGICIKTTSEDGRLERFHHFDLQSLYYKGFFDRDLDAHTSPMALSCSYHHTNKDGDRRFETRKRVGLYEVGKKKIISANEIPSIKIDQEGNVTLVNADKIEKINEGTPLERLVELAKREGKTPAEIYGERDGSLKDEEDLVDKEEINPLPIAKFDTSGVSQMESEEGEGSSGKGKY